MAMRTVNEETTWQLAALRAGVKAARTGLALEQAPAETLRRARGYVRRLKGITPAEKAKRAIDYAYWFLDTYLDLIYRVVWDEAPDCELPDNATDEEVAVALATDLECVAWNARLDAIGAAQEATRAAYVSDGAVGIVVWCMAQAA